MNRLRALALTTTFIAGFSVALATAPAQAEKPDEKNTFEILQMFSDVFQMVRRDYVEEVSDEELIEAAIQGMLRSLDPHSVYLDGDNYEAMRTDTRGEFGGLGIEVSMDENGFVRVVSPIDDTPAFRAGLKSGDYITHLDGESVQGLSLNQAVEKMRGPVGEDIILTIAREGEEPFDVTVTRDRIEIRSVRYRVKDNIGYIRLSKFSEKTQPGLERAIGRIKEATGDDLVGYVLDLRNNPGGLLSQAIKVSDSFLEQGMIVSTRGRDKDDAQVVHANAGDLTEGKPVVVLINAGSASASEIVAGALQDHGRAILVGVPSFGKGSVQTIKPLAGGSHSAVKLTTQRYYTPSGKSIQALGIVPDIMVEQAKLEKLERPRVRHEADLRGSLKNDNGEEGEDGEAEKTEEEKPRVGDATLSPEDYQLNRAMDLLQGIALYRDRTLN